MKKTEPMISVNSVVSDIMFFLAVPGILFLLVLMHAIITGLYQRHQDRKPLAVPLPVRATSASHLR